jgi:hypothetical protein
MFAFSSSWPTWFKRLGVTGVLFVLLKGLLWLSLPALLAVRSCPG